MVCKGCAERAKRLENIAAALLMTMVLVLAAFLAGGFYYDLNDDVLIKDILSGVYTGKPEAHTMQILFPLGWVLSLLYLIPGIPVFGIFLCLCQFGSIFVIAYRSLAFCHKSVSRVICLMVQLLFWAGAFLEHLVFLQYTVTAGMLIGAAIFWVVTSAGENAAAEEAQSTVRFFGMLAESCKEYLPALVLYWIGFCLRSEMGLLLLPVASAAGFCRWFLEKKPFGKKNLVRYMGLFAALMTGILLCLGIDSLAYGSDDWREFQKFFDARTTLYDYQYDMIAAYEANQAVYEELGITKTQQVLLQNYNFGANDAIDAGYMEALAQRASDRPQSGLFKKDLSAAVWELLHLHFFSKKDFGWNLVMMGAGMLLFVSGFCKGKRQGLWQVPFVAACCCVLWIFIILRDRVPVRITTPLYLGSIVTFCGLLMLQTQSREAELKQAVSRMMLGLLALLLIGSSAIKLKDAIPEVSGQANTRQQINRVNEAVLAYCSQQPDILFLEDVYSTVAFSEKIELDRDKPFNYDLLGGWLVKSPHSQKKLQAFGLESMGEAMLGKENVRLLTEAESDFSWLEESLAENGICITAVLEETIAEGAVEVYRIELTEDEIP